MKKKDSMVKLENSADSLEISKMINKSATTKGDLLRIGAQIRKMRRLAQMEVKLKKSRYQIQKVNADIINYERQFESQRKKLINENLMHIGERKKKREFDNRQTNTTLAKIKVQLQTRQKVTQSLADSYTKEYDNVIEKKLQERKEKMKINFDLIHAHENEYMSRVKNVRYTRVKSQQSEETKRSNYTNFKQKSIDAKQQRLIRSNSQIKRQLVIDLVTKKRLCEQNIQRETDSIRTSAYLLQKLKSNMFKERFDKAVESYNFQRNMTKSKQGKDLHGSLSLSKNIQYSSVRNKLTRYSNLAQDFSQRYDKREKPDMV